MMPARSSEGVNYVEPEATVRRLAAVLSADVAGYSGLVAQEDVGALRTLKTYSKVIGGLNRQYGGRVGRASATSLLPLPG